MKLYINNRYFNINNDVKFSLIKLINFKSIYIGIFKIKDALFLAKNLNSDLVELSSNYYDFLSVCKLIKYGRFQYVENKKYLKKIEKIKSKFLKRKKNDKEMSFSLFIEIKDYCNKILKIKKFLNFYFNVKVFIVAKGRMALKRGLIFELMDRIKFDLCDYSFILNGSITDISNQFYLYFYNSKNV